MRLRFLAISVGTKAECAATMKPNEWARFLNGHLLLRPDLDRAQQLEVLAWCLDEADFWAENHAYVPVRPVLVPRQRFTPIESLYLGSAVRS